MADNLQTIKLPLTEYVREIAMISSQVGARIVLEEHIKNCPAPSQIVQLSHELTTLKIRFATLIGFMCGSGLLGGTAGALITEMFSK